MCIYNKANKELPYPRVAWISSCGFQLAIMEGYKHKVWKNCSGKSSFSTRTDELELPKGNCMKCGEDITV